MRFEDIKNYGVNFADNTDFKQFGVSDNTNKKILVFEEFKKYLKEQGIELDDKQIIEMLNSGTKIETLQEDSFSDIFKSILDLNGLETPAQPILSEPAEIAPPADESLGTSNNPNETEVQVQKVSGGSNYCEIVNLKSVTPVESTMLDLKNFNNAVHFGTDGGKVEGNGNVTEGTDYCHVVKLNSEGFKDKDNKNKIRQIAEHMAMNDFIFRAANKKNGGPKYPAEIFKEYQEGEPSTTTEGRAQWEEEKDELISKYEEMLGNYKGSLEDYVFELNAATNSQMTLDEFRNSTNSQDKLQQRIELLWDIKDDELTAHQKAFKDSIDLYRKAISKAEGRDISDIDLPNYLYDVNGESSKYVTKEARQNLIKNYLLNTPDNELSEYEKDLKKLFDKEVIQGVEIGTDLRETTELEDKFLSDLGTEGQIEYLNMPPEKQSAAFDEYILKNYKGINFDKFVEDCERTGQWGRITRLFELASGNSEEASALRAKLATSKSLGTIFANAHNMSIFTESETLEVTEGFNTVVPQDRDRDNIYNIANQSALSEQSPIILRQAKMGRVSLETRQNMIAYDQNKITDLKIAKELANEINNQEQDLINFSAANSVNVENPELQDIYFTTAVKDNAETAKYVTENGILAKLHEENQAKAYDTTHHAFETGLPPEEASEWNRRLQNQISTLSPEAQQTIASNPEYAQELTNYTANAMARDRELSGYINNESYAGISKTDKEIFREQWEAMTPTERYNFICNISLKNFNKLSPSLRKRILEHAKNDPVFMKNLVKKYGLDLLKNQLFPDALSIIVRELLNDPSERIKAAREVCNNTSRYPASLVEDCQLILAEHNGIDENTFNQMTSMEKVEALKYPDKYEGYIASAGAQSGTNRNNLPDYSNDFFKKRSNLDGLV